MTKQYLTFNMDGQIYGFPIQKVREINRISEVTKVPNVAVHYSGVMNLRGAIISVISLRMKLGLAKQDTTKSTCTVVVENEGRQVAAVVDSVNSVVDFEEDQIDRSSVGQSEVSYIAGMAKLENKIVMLIDIPSCLFSSEEPDPSLLEAV